tara:strand:+ start:2713 stop:5040 length:2328 start_codon:yes stop_codon:yes gene_type:complete
MAYDNNINPGNPPLVWSRIKEAFDKVNENFTIIGSNLARERELSIAHIESGTVNSNPVRIVTTEIHDLIDYQQVFVFNTGVSQLDNNEYYVKKESDTEVFLYTDQLLTTAVDGTAFDAYSSGGGKIQGFSEYAGTDFENLNTNVSPNSVATFNLGSVTKPWKSLYTGEHADNDANAFNGIWLGSAQIKGKPGGIVDLPLGSTVNGSLIINPDQTFFKSVQVDSGNQVVADDFVDTLNLISGTAISMAVDSAAESITITNTGVTQLTAGLGLGISSATGNVTVTNTGVRSIQSTTALPSGRAAGAGINIDNSTGDNVKITNAGVLEIQPGSAALTVFTDAATGIVTITNASPAGNAYRTVDVKGTFLAAPSIAGTLVVEEGNGIVLTGNSGTQTLNIAFSGQSDITGSVFADDSTVLVDAIDAKIIGPVDTTSLRTSDDAIILGNGATAGAEAVSIGKNAGDSGDYSQAIGNNAGNTGQGVAAVALGSQSGETSQGDKAVAVGQYAGQTSQSGNAIAIGEASGKTTQGSDAVAIGRLAGWSSQGASAIAIGYTAGKTSQGNDAVAIGDDAGETNQGAQSIAIGDEAGQTNQGIRSIAIGQQAGETTQGNYAVAIGYEAGTTNQGSNSITLNATGASLENTQANSFVIKPVRNIASANIAMYNPTTGELTHTANPEFNLTGDVTGSVFADNSTQLVDGVDGVLRGTHVGELIGSVFSDDSSVVINESGTVLGTIAPGATAPASETEAAPVGEIRVDDSYVYVRKSTGWGKIAIGGWV